MTKAGRVIALLIGFGMILAVLAGVGMAMGNGSSDKALAKEPLANTQIPTVTPVFPTATATVKPCEFVDGETKFKISGNICGHYFRDLDHWRLIGRPRSVELVAANGWRGQAFDCGFLIVNETGYVWFSDPSPKATNKTPCK